MAQLLTAMVAPVAYRNCILHTPYGNIAIAANGNCSVDTRIVAPLLKIGFTSATLPDISNKASLGTTVSLACPAGISQIQGLGADNKPVAGRVTVSRDQVEALLSEGFTN